MRHDHPPKLAHRFFEWWCGRAKVDDLLGDLDEWYSIHAKTKSPFQATLLYWKQIFSLSFSYTVRKRKRDAASGMYSTSNFSMDMLRNYLKVAVRNLYQYKYFSVLNVFGLAIGMSVSLLLIALVAYIKTYDTFHIHQDHIYTVVSDRTEGVEQRQYATAPVVLAEKLEQHPDIEEVVRIQAGFREEIKQDKGTLPIKGYYVEPNFLKVFTYQVTQGDPVSALTKPNTIIITESAAQKIFNTTHVLGNTLEMEQGGLLEIGAVMKDHPINSHLAFEVLVSYATLPPVKTSVADQWMNYGRQYVYVVLKEDRSIDQLNEYLNKIAQDTYASLPIKATFDTQHLHAITMGPDYNQAIGPKWEMSGMVVFSIIAAMILLPACFNYTNISIARALKRAKEIGLRKTMGGVRNQIFIQFITETVVITMISLAGAILIFLLIRSEFQSMMVASSSIDLSLTGKTVFLFFLFALATGLLAGAFPAFYFGGLNPIQALKNKIRGRSSAMRVRKVLTVFQFALSFGFILSLVVFSRQYQYSIGFDFGFTKNNIVNVPLQNVEPRLLQAEFSPLAQVQSIAFSSDVLGLGFSNSWVKNSVNDSLEVAQVFVDRNYLSTFGLTLLAGGNFPEEAGSEGDTYRERFIIVNEEFLKAYKMDQPMDAIGQTFLVDSTELEVIGVVKNFHFAPLRLPISKFFFRMNPQHYAYAHVTVKPEDPFHLFSQLEDRWKKLSERKMEASFFEDDLNEGYSMYQTLLKIVGFLGVLALTISMLGMLGMVVYTSETRSKEVSIRKVLGATVPHLTLLLSSDYLKLMVWAILIAVPVTALFFHWTLPQIQYYSVTLNGWDVLLSTIILMGIGLATIASQTLKTARANPADTLRAE
jgi:ABC-type antimicrobial peptide transport system permease subunit